MIRPHLRPGVRAGVPLALAAVMLGVSFGVLARPVMGSVAPIVMSAVVFAGAAQFGALAVLASGGGALPAITAGILLNARFLPMGIAIGPSLPGSPARRAAEGQAVVDASWALANQGDGRFDRHMLIGATLPQYAGWVLGTAIGVALGDRIGNPEDYGLDALFPAFFLALLVPELRDRRTVAVALAGGAIALALAPVAPAGVPVLAACLVALVGIRP
ncbi:MAG TPA: AzlC family ABC transporter permease [Thermoleophilaceae bacterium]|nr:AzlC family ABC transporter permease [Thermoleophilaceae bacterium]